MGVFVKIAQKWATLFMQVEKKGKEKRQPWGKLPFQEKVFLLWGIAKTVYNVLGVYEYYNSTGSLKSVHKLHKNCIIFLCKIHKNGLGGGPGCDFFIPQMPITSDCLALNCGLRGHKQ